MGPCPMCFLLVLAASLSDRRLSVNGEKSYKNEENIGTVLFERSDCGRRCWSSEEFAILNSRRMFQDILPKVSVINCQNDRYIALLMDYFHICLECVRKLSIGKTKHLMLKALADTMGGYLKVYILPMTKRSYYAGNVKYRNALRLFELYDELKKFLRTNGDGWRKPIPVGITRHIKTPPIVVTPTKSSTACSGLVTYAPHNENDARDYQQYSFKKKRLTHRRRKSMRRSIVDPDENRGSDSGAVTVPLPFLDDVAEPNSIALPFKKDNLQSLSAEKSAFALVKYYVASVKCIASRSRTNVELSKFKRDLHEWLRRTVTPHLEDDKWYPAFGGVLRVMASLKDSGFAGDTSNQRSAGGEYQVMPKFVTETTAKRPEDAGAPPLYRNRTDENSLNFGTTELIVIALASALLVWLFVGLTLVCYRFLRRHSDDCGPCESRASPPVAVLYEKRDYCTPDVCPSRGIRKSAADKLKEWWNSRFGGCPGGCDRYEDEERCLATMSYTSKDTVAASNSSKCIQKRQHNKSVLVSRPVSPRERRSLKRVCYTSDETSTSSSGPTKTRIGTSTGDE